MGGRRVCRIPFGTGGSWDMAASRATTSHHTWVALTVPAPSRVDSLVRLRAAPVEPKPGARRFDAEMDPTRDECKTALEAAVSPATNIRIQETKRPARDAVGVRGGDPSRSGSQRVGGEEMQRTSGTDGEPRGPSYGRRGPRAWWLEVMVQMSMEMGENAGNEGVGGKPNAWECRSIKRKRKDLVWW